MVAANHDELIVLPFAFRYPFGVSVMTLAGQEWILVAEATDRDPEPDKTLGRIRAFHRDGSGTIVAGTVVDDPRLGWLERMSVGDLDGDGLPDIVAVSNNFFNGVSGAGGVVLFTNPGADNQSRAAWKTTTIATESVLRPYDTAIGDIDGDEAPDVVVGYFTGPPGDLPLVWYKNCSHPRSQRCAGPAWVPKKIDTSFSAHRSILLEDLDRDGLLDVTITDEKQGRVYTYYNRGNGSFGPQITVADSLHQPMHGHFARVDGDRCPDLVLASFGGDVSWYHTPCDGEPISDGWPATPIGFLPSAFEALPIARPDGSVEVWVTSFLEGIVVRYELSHVSGRGTGSVKSKEARRIPYCGATAISAFENGIVFSAAEGCAPERRVDQVVLFRR